MREPSHHLCRLPCQRDATRFSISVRCGACTPDAAGADGGDGWSFDGGPPKRTFGIEATAGQTAGVKKLSGLRFDEILPRVTRHGCDGIDVSVVYPANAIFVYIEPDRELGLACLRSYNDWILDEFQGRTRPVL